SLSTDLRVARRVAGEPSVADRADRGYGLPSHGELPVATADPGGGVSVAEPSSATAGGNRDARAAGLIPGAPARSRACVSRPHRDPGAGVRLPQPPARYTLRAKAMRPCPPVPIPHSGHDKEAGGCSGRARTEAAIPHLPGRPLSRGDDGR